MTEAATPPKKNTWRQKGPRNKYLQVTVTEEELDAIEFLATESGSTRSSWSRAVLLRELREYGFKTKKE